jgi:exopolysaccharide biosynthesis predicted pyruvyltransferase EpsI
MERRLMLSLQTVRVRTIESYLATLPRETLSIKINPGNAGDALIALGTFQVFQRMGIDYRVISDDDDLEGKTVVYGGGGNLVPYYGEAAAFIRRVHRKVKRLIILPHTIRGHETLIASLGENVDIVCRERHSLEHVQSINVRSRVFLVEDMAFAIDVDAILAGRFRSGTPGPRFDSAAVRYHRTWMRHVARYRLRRFKRERIKRSVPIPPRRTLNCFREDAEKTDVLIPWDNLDLSWIFGPEDGQIDERAAARISRSLLRFISTFEVVNTNRLHIGIAGALLGKEVNLYGNSYNKIQAIYQLSIKNRFPNVRWMG